VALPVGFYGSLQWIGWLSLLDEVALNHWNTQSIACNSFIHIHPNILSDIIKALLSVTFNANVSLYNYFL